MFDTPDIGLPAGEALETRQVLPSALEQIETGPFLAGILSAIDPAQLNGHDAVRYMKAAARMEAHFAAKRLAATREVAYSPPSGPDADVIRSADELEFASTEIAAALNLTRRSAERELGLALSLESHPQVTKALDSGAIDERRAKVICHETIGLGQEDGDRIVSKVLEDAGHLTTGQLRARLQRMAIEHDPAAAERRYREGVQDRGVAQEANPDGTTDLKGFQLPPNRVGRVMTRINSYAMKLKRSGDSRTIDQIRADVFLDLLDGAGTGGTGAKGVVSINVDLTTLAEMTDAPGDLAGYGPVIADIARQVALEQPNAEWRFNVRDKNGELIHVGTTRRRPNAEMQRLVEEMNRTCVHPGCRMPAAQCDIDHTEPHSEGGVTCICNTSPLCRHHHRARHEGGWQYAQDDGNHVFVSPLRHRYGTGNRSP